MRRTKLWLTVMVMAIGWANGVRPASAQSFLEWKGLEAGSFAVGFRSEIVFDRTRTIQAPRDFFGRPHPNYGARPIQISIWYPAAAAASGTEQTFGDYLPLLGWPIGAGEKGAQERAEAELKFIQGVTPAAGPPDPAVLGRFLKTEIRARKYAAPAPGRFPVLVYAPGSGYPAFDNSVLFEFLASQGIVIIAAPSAGPDAKRIGEDLESLEAQTRDMEFLIGHVQGWPQADPERIFCAGYSGGGIPAVLAAIRNRRVKAVISLDGTIAHAAALQAAKGHPDLAPSRLVIPLLLIARPAANDRSGFGDRSFFQKAPNSRRVEAVVQGMEHHDMASLPSLLRRAAKPNAGRDWGPATKGYEEICRLILRFLKETAADSGRNGKRPAWESTGNLSITVTEAQPAVATPSDFLEVLAADGLPRAGDLLRNLRQEHPEALPPFEGALIGAAFDLLFSERSEEAIQLLALGEETLPEPFNAAASLGDVYLELGDLERAESCYRDLLKKLEAAKELAPERKQQFSAYVERALRAVDEQHKKKP